MLELGTFIGIVQMLELKSSCVDEGSTGALAEAGAGGSDRAQLGAEEAGAGRIWGGSPTRRRGGGRSPPALDKLEPRREGHCLGRASIWLPSFNPSPLTLLLPPAGCDLQVP
ncbi:hypothetical protein C2845_PM13G20500 [Panicum miliaceum]|uniref:Uncharacterized protein n=1 Tax=Panicum miliaceum TaxID=4540 RepID=A0A3L6REU3_PANMI|nr:hypothetical protein C2845_PM13G20500 [Panicum miliaceum]